MDNLLPIVIVLFIVFVLGLVLLFDKNAKNSAFFKNRERLLNELSALYEALLNNTIDASFAIIKADTIFDNALKLKVVGGETMAERLKLAKKFFIKKLYNDIWDSHKTRNQIVHENKQIDKDRAKLIINTYKSAIQSL